MEAALPKSLAAMAAAVLVGLALATGAALGEERPDAIAGEGATTARSSGGEVVREARGYLGRPHDYRNRRCRASAATIDNPCLTRVVYVRFGVTLPDDVRRQWLYGKRVGGGGPQARGRGVLRRRQKRVPRHRGRPFGERELRARLRLLQRGGRERCASRKATAGRRGCRCAKEVLPLRGGVDERPLPKGGRRGCGLRGRDP
jgi:hypothetical protein